MENSIGILNALKIISVAAGVAVDTSGFEGVLFVSVDGGTLQPKHGATTTTANVGDPVVLTAYGQLQIHKPLKRYVAVTGGGICVAILYGARTLPANVANSANLISPE